MISKVFFADNLSDLLERRFLKTKSKGIDKLTALMAKDRGLIDFNVIQKKISVCKFDFSPYLELLKAKKRNKFPRMISIPTIRDRVVLLALKEYLHVKFKESVNKKMANSYLRDIKSFIQTNRSKKIYFLKADIESFYDKINHDKLSDILKKQKLPKYAITLITKAITNPTLTAGSKKSERYTHGNRLGVPQGLAISNILAQIYLSSLDDEFYKKNVLYLRYVDDILILMTTNRIKQYKKSLEKILDEYSLSINLEKTSDGELTDFVPFLGYTFSNDKIGVSNRNIDSLIQRIAAKVTWLKKHVANPSLRPTWINNEKRLKQIFLEEVNEKITGAMSGNKNYGWLFYFVEMTDQSLLFKLDKIIERIIMKSGVYKTRPKGLKRMVRAFYEIKYNNGGSYVMDYDKFDTIRKKRSFLVFRGRLNQSLYYTDMEINLAFERYKTNSLKDLEQEVGYKYF